MTYPHTYVTGLIVGIAALAAPGCTAVQQIAENSSPAKTPVLRSLQAAPSATGAFAVVVADQYVTPGAFMVLPSGIPNGLPRGVIKISKSSSPRRRC